MSFGDGLPDQLGDVEDQIRSGLTRLASIANPAHTYQARPYPCHSTMIVAPSSASMAARKSGREADHPALRVGEADAVQRFKPPQRLPRKCSARCAALRLPEARQPHGKTCTLLPLCGSR